MARASLRVAARVGRMRRPATGVPEEWPPPLRRGVGTARGGTEPGLHAVWRFLPAKAAARTPRLAALTVDGLADQTGITADSGGEPGEWQLARLRSAPLRVRSSCVVEIPICAIMPQQTVPSLRAEGRPRGPHVGGKNGRSGGIARFRYAGVATNPAPTPLLGRASWSELRRVSTGRRAIDRHNSSVRCLMASPRAFA